jgi:hypothetical protein
LAEVQKQEKVPRTVLRPSEVVFKRAKVVEIYEKAQ